MSNVIDFLERMGQDAQLRYARGSELEQALIRAGIEPAVRQAICAASHSHVGARKQDLDALLGASTNVCCMVRLPGHDDDSEAGDDVAPPATRLAGADRSQLEALLGATANVCCMVQHGEDDDDESDSVASD